MSNTIDGNEKYECVYLPWKKPCMVIPWNMLIYAVELESLKITKKIKYKRIWRSNPM